MRDSHSYPNHLYPALLDCFNTHYTAMLEASVSRTSMLLLRLSLLFPFLIGEGGGLTRASDISVVSSLQDDLQFDNEARLSSHYLLYPEGCDYYSSGEVPSYGIQAYAVTGDALTELFSGHSNVENCPAVCLERGVQQSLVGAVLPDRYYLPTQKGKRDSHFQKWFSSKCRQAELCLLNYISKDDPLQVYWINFKGQRVFQFDLKYGERNTICTNTFIGHYFDIILKSGELVQHVVVEHTMMLPFGESPPSDDVSHRNFTREITNALKTEWNRHERIQRTFSPLGFSKGRLPDDVFASLGALYYNNRGNITVEEWGGRGVFVNWWETKVAFLQIPWKIKDMHQKRLKDMVSEWAGVEVEETVMYGFRQYQEGARLLTHVDRHTTHAVSLIVNVAQGGLEEPWPVEVYDHGGRLHEIVMEPGDVVYYESAKNLHGRNRPLEGKDAYYVNMFTHYRPVAEGDDWWKNAEAQPRSPPVIDAVGECRLDTDTLTTLGEQLGAVQCDDARLGTSISPAMVEAKNADDLFAWWLYTSPVKDDPEDNATAEEEPHMASDEL
jgi:hypothetical protein